MEESKTRINLETVFRKCPDVIERMIDGEAVLLDTNTGVYYSLEDTGSRIWEMLDGTMTISDIVSRIVEEYEVSEDRAIEDAGKLFADLEREGLVEPC